MTRNAIVRQRDLFEADERQTAPIPVQRATRKRIVREIATALIGGEVDDDQDHG
jgi:hypothetical protein